MRCTHSLLPLCLAGFIQHAVRNGKKRAIVATARKLAVLLHHLWVSGGDGSEPLYRVRPTRVFGLIEKSFPKTATRWTFD